jgi:hypothetical protein
MVDDRERPYHANLQGQPWSKLGLQEKARVRGLIFALAKYQRHIHLRQYRSYSEDLELITKVENAQKEFLLGIAHIATIAIIVNGVVGDSIISNASWIAGTKKAGFDFHDTCIVILRYGGGGGPLPSPRHVFCLA